MPSAVSGEFSREEDKIYFACCPSEPRSLPSAAGVEEDKIYFACCPPDSVLCLPLYRENLAGKKIKFISAAALRRSSVFAAGLPRLQPSAKAALLLLARKVKKRYNKKAAAFHSCGCLFLFSLGSCPPDPALRLPRRRGRR